MVGAVAVALKDMTEPLTGEETKKCCKQIKKTFYHKEGYNTINSNQEGKIWLLTRGRREEGTMRIMLSKQVIFHAKC